MIKTKDGKQVEFTKPTNPFCVMLDRSGTRAKEINPNKFCPRRRTPAFNSSSTEEKGEWNGQDFTGKYNS